MKSSSGESLPGGANSAASGSHPYKIPQPAQMLAYDSDIQIRRTGTWSDVGRRRSDSARVRRRIVDGIGVELNLINQNLPPVIFLSFLLRVSSSGGDQVNLCYTF